MVYNYLLLTLICNLKEEIYCTPSEVFQQRSMFMVYNRIADSVTLRFFYFGNKTELQTTVADLLHCLHCRRC